MNTALVVILGASYLFGVCIVAGVLYAYGERENPNINPPDYDTTDE